MDYKVRQVTPDGDLWPEVARLFPEVIKWMNDPDDEGNYHFFVVTDNDGVFLGGSVIDISDLGFGPASAITIGFLEDIEVLPAHRRRGVGTFLLCAVLAHAWRVGCHTVRWAVDYDNEAGLALYQKLGAGLVPNEDPDAEQPESRYTVVAINPERVAAGYAAMMPGQRSE